jgi:hypothetical protein
MLHPCPEIDEWNHPTAHDDTSRRRTIDARNHPQKSRFPRTVAADDAQHFPAPYRKRNVVDRHEMIGFLRPPSHMRCETREHRSVIREEEALREMARFNDGVCIHPTSLRVRGASRDERRK